MIVWTLCPCLVAAVLREPKMPKLIDNGRSRALPFLPRPHSLDGTMVGDFGFDPLGLAEAAPLARMREAEVRHGRLAMVATWGWPIAEISFSVAKRLVPPSSVCSGNGCAADVPLASKALSLSEIGFASMVWWGSLAAGAVCGELAATGRSSSEPSFDPLRLWLDAEPHERTRLELAELKHGRLAMMALLAYWGWRLAAVAAAPKTSLTFAHQLWGQTCVYDLVRANGVCYAQDVPSFDFVLSWEILYRVITGYFAEPYF